MIALDTHIWIWCVQKDSRLNQQHEQWLQQYRSEGLGVSIFSCWEVAKLVEKQRLVLPETIDRWMEMALAYPGVRLLGLTLPIVVKATQLEGFHNDSADQITQPIKSLWQPPKSMPVHCSQLTPKSSIIPMFKF